MEKKSEGLEYSAVLSGCGEEVSIQITARKRDPINVYGVRYEDKDGGFIHDVIKAVNYNQAHNRAENFCMAHGYRKFWIVLEKGIG